LVRGRGLISHGIAWWGFGWNGDSHADAVLPDGSLLGARDDRIKIKDGRVIPPGVQVRPAGYKRWERRTLYWKPTTKERAQAWRDALLAVADRGTAYDREGILRLILGEQPIDDGKYFCSCLMIAKLQECNEVGKLPVAPQQVSPTALGMLLGGLDWSWKELPV